MTNKPAYRYTVEYIRTGQPRAYADHEDIYHITIEFKRWRPYKGYDAEFTLADDLGEINVIPHIKKFCHWVEPNDKMSSTEFHFAPHLEYIKKIGEGKWEVFIRTAFTD